MGVDLPDQRQRADASCDESRWPARTKRLIGEVRSLCRTWLGEPLRLCLGDFDRRLHEISDRTRSHVDQQRYLATRQRLMQERQAFEARFITSVDSAFATLGSGASGSPQTPALRTLSLLDPLEHELTAAMDQLVARSEARCGPLLVELGYRLAVLIGAPPLDAEALPLGPQAMAKAFRDASAALGLPTVHHLLLLQSLESTLIQGLTPLYEMVNNHLQADGILPDLRAFPLPRAAARAPRQAEPQTAASFAPAPAPTPAPARPQPVPAPRAPAQAVPPPPPANLLQYLRSRLSAGVQLANPGLAATSAQVQAALGQLQGRLRGVDGSGQITLYSGAKWREEITRGLLAGQPRNAPALELDDKHRDVVELVAALFVQIDRQLPAGNVAHGVLGQFQMPILRMAIASPDEFFNRRDHPAQRFLALALETARDWADEPASEASRHLLVQIEQWIDQLGREPPMAAVYTRMLAALEQSLAQLKRKAQIAEKRHVEAMQGRERLEQARSRAAEVIAERFVRGQPRGLLRALLDRAWSDVLALTLLRQGETSDAFASRLAITDRLLGLLPPGNLQQLQEEVETGLAQIGMQGDEAAQVAQRLLGALPDPASAEVPSATDLAMRLKQRQRLGEAQAGDLPAAAAPAPAHASDEESRLYQQLLQAPAGGWFEFGDPASGRALQRKLAWSSSVSGRSLLVTRHGQRAEEMTLLELARAIATGQAVALADASGSLLDRAWQALRQGLQSAPMAREACR